MVETAFIAVEQSMPLTAELEDFINAISTGSKPRVTVQDGLEIVKILEAGTVQH
jgi:predicted dehydrogenase